MLCDCPPEVFGLIPLDANILYCQIFHEHVIYYLIEKVVDYSSGLHWIGLSPSGFTTCETKLHVVCESKLNKLAKLAGMSQDIFWQSLPNSYCGTWSKKTLTSKKVLKLSIQKVVIF